MTGIEMDEKTGPASSEKDDETTFGKVEEEKEVQMVPYSTLFRFATTGDKLRFFFAIIAAIGTGASMPLMFIVFGSMTDTFVDLGKYANCFKFPVLNDNGTWTPNNVYYPPCIQGQDPALPNLLPGFNATGEPLICYDTAACEILVDENHTEVLQGIFGDADDFMDTMFGYTLFYIYFGLGTWICAWIQTTFLMAQASNQINVIRRKFFESILRQDIGFFDTNSAGELNTRLADDIKKIADGMGDKVGVTAQSVARFIAGLSIAFIYGWKLALVIMSIFPILIVSALLMFGITTSYTKKELDAYAQAGAIAEEVLNSIKTVTSFAGQQEEINRYEKNLITAKDVGIKKAVSTGFSIGTLFLVLYSAYGLGFWYGGKLVIEEGYSIGDVMLVFFGMLTGAMSLSVAANNVEFFAKARVAAHEIFTLIDRVTPIDALSEDGLKLPVQNIKAEISLKNISFTYPARLDHQVLHNVSFSANEGETVALCGQSGCGKSTCIQLIQRFYDPQEGGVYLGGHDIKTLNVKFLRDMIGVVSQEPILFETTIIENIRYGRLDVTDAEIKQAAKQANAYDFIQNLPKQWDTEVGEGGATLSGGQKQRVAIARALVRNPKILLLDEATSALDTESESIVQAALEKASEGRTTIVIAHRLSTIRSADKIFGFAGGRIVEEGTHKSLLEIENGVYANLCNMQTFEKAAPSEKAKESKKKIVLDRQKSQNQDKEEEVKEDLPTSPWSKIMAMNGPETPYIVVGIFFAAITGAAQPLFAVVFAEILTIFSDDLSDEEMTAEINKAVIAFVILGGVNFVGNIGAISCFGKSGEELTKRIRSKAFTKFLALEMAYFDHPLNSTGALTTRLATDASRVQGATGSRLALVTQNMCSLGFAFAIAFYFEWRLTLVCTAFVPIMAASGFFMMQLFSGKMALKEQQAFENAGQIATEATLNIRTVASLARERTFYNRYIESLQIPIKAAKNKEILYGLAYGSSQGIIFFAYAGCFYYGAYLIDEGILPPERFSDIYKVLMAVVFGAMAVGQSSAFAPDFGEAKLSAYRMLKLFELESKIDPNSTEGEMPPACKGTVTFTDINFTYPTRPDVKVLKGLTVDVLPGQTLALVGQSGCGKSTCIQLIQRFYDGTSGDITIDGTSIPSLNIKWLRAQIGFVQQEPILFDKTIEENILYGLDEDIGTSNAAFTSLTDPSNKISPDKENNWVKVEKAAKEANAFNFIKELPSGFKTNCGKKGNQLSGGQKQRVAIARALIREPKILLLDEATSALDAESEKIVQDALDRAREGRTCILIAHRLSTVISADKIAVVDNGVIVEAGTHAELINNKGAYYSLVNSQL